MCQGEGRGGKMSRRRTKRGGAGKPRPGASLTIRKSSGRGRGRGRASSSRGRGRVSRPAPVKPVTLPPSAIEYYAKLLPGPDEDVKKELEKMK